MFFFNAQFWESAQQECYFVSASKAIWCHHSCFVCVMSGDVDQNGRGVARPVPEKLPYAACGNMAWCWVITSVVVDLRRSSSGDGGILTSLLNTRDWLIVYFVTNYFSRGDFRAGSFPNYLKVGNLYFFIQLNFTAIMSIVFSMIKFTNLV